MTVKLPVVSNRQQHVMTAGTALTAGRATGLTLALGFGAALLTGLAAPASADASETPGPGGRSGAADAAAAVRSGPAAGPRAAVTRRTAAVKPQSAGSGTDRAGAGDSGTIPTRTLPAVSGGVPAAKRVVAGSLRPETDAVAASAAPPNAAASVLDTATGPAPRPAAQRGNVLARLVRAPSSAVVAAAPTPEAPTASAAGPSLLEGLLDLFCPTDPRGRLITIYKGTHFAIPNSFGFFIREVTGTGTFTSDTTYDLKDSDQFDWNKFTGIAFTPLEPDRDSAMVGWRYNLTTEEFEIAPFYNVDKVRILPKPPDIISVPAGETFDYLVDYTGVTLTYGDQTVFKAYPEGLIPNVWTAARVSGWFGGNRVAPRTVSYYLRID